MKKLDDEGYRSLAIVLVHSYTFPDSDRERLIGRFHPHLRICPTLTHDQNGTRGVSSTADAYLTSILRKYLDGFFNGFDAKLKYWVLELNLWELMEVYIVVDLNNFSGLKSILSGPAGGVVGYVLTSWEKYPVIGFVVISFHCTFFEGSKHVTHFRTSSLLG